MSMTAEFVQVEDADLARLKARPDLAEGLFVNMPALPPAFGKLTATMQDRVRTAGPQMLAEVLSRMDPNMRQQVEASLRQTVESLARGQGGDAILQMMQQRMAARAGAPSPIGKLAVLSLDKAWHGVHYVLCGELEPGATLLSQAVLGGADLGDDDGFSGYGPARCFTAAQVAEISRALSRPELEPEAVARFDAERMSRIEIYPGFQPSDSEWVMDAFRRLRDFYADAAAHRHALVTCLV